MRGKQRRERRCHGLRVGFDRDLGRGWQSGEQTRQRVGIEKGWRAASYVDRLQFAGE